jgi:uncharacterized protein YndB with AHSA1/START domain
MPAAGNDAFTLTRTIDAPRPLVWESWTQEKHLKNWFGPAGSRLVACRMDLKVGGTFHYGMEIQGGTVMWGKWTFREIEAPAKLVLVSSFSDEQGGLTRHPFSPHWPLETLSTTRFSEDGGRTRIDLEWEPINATPEEMGVFANSHAGMNQGWNGTFERLVAYLAETGA